MNYDNVKLWFAKNENDDIVTINEITENNKHNTYNCPMCGSKLIPKAVKSKQVSSHFAHVDVSQCGESMYHYWFKHKFLEKGDTFTIISDKELEYIVKDVLVEQEYSVEDKVYRPDVTITTECGNTIYFEMAFSNKKKVKDYLDIWLELKNIVVEVDIKTLMNQDNVPKFKALFYDGKCFNTNKNDMYYNTIGTYKVEKLKGNVDEKLKERIRKLDWFWDDLTRYKNGDIDIESLIDIAMMIEMEDIKLVVEILKRQKCIDVHEYFIHKKADVIFECITNVLKNRKMSNLFKVEKENVIKYKKLQTIEIGIYQWGKGYRSIDIDVLSRSDTSIIKHLNNVINEIIIDKTMEELKKYFNKQDHSFSYYISTVNKITITIYNEYTNNYEFVLNIPDNIINTNDSSIIKEFITENVLILTDNLSSNIDSPRLNKIFYKYKNYFDDYIIKKEKITKSYEKTYSISFDYEILNEKVKIIPRIYGLKDSEFAVSIDNNDIYKNNHREINTEKIHNFIVDSVSKLIYKYFNKYNCSNCDKEIKLSAKEIDFYFNKGFELPKRCKCCRDKRKQNKLNKEE